MVEIAIVLVVVGLLVSGGLMGVSPVLQANKVTQTNAQLDKIEQALVLYVIQNGCLPCPASPTGTGNATDANGSYSTGCWPTGQSAGVACTPLQGVVPWVNLGLARTDVVDAYNNFIDYVPTAGLNTSNTSMVRTPPATYPAGTLDVQNLTPVEQTSVAAYVLISHGPDGSFAYQSINGTQRTDPNSSAPQACNAVGQAAACTAAGTPTYATGYYIQDQPRSAGRYFDDIVRFKSAPVIVQSCGANACGNPA